jgi:hypothetical protein
LLYVFINITITISIIVTITITLTIIKHIQTYSTTHIHTYKTIQHTCTNNLFNTTVFDY